MTQLTLLENPRGKKKRRKSTKNPSPAQLRARRNFARMAKARAKSARSTKRNPRTALGTRVVKHRPVFYGSKSKLGVRSSLKRLNPMRHKKRHSRRHYRRNPVMAHRGGSGGGQNVFKTALVGAGGIIANNLISGLISPILGGFNLPIIGDAKGLVKVALPIVAGTTIGKRNALVRQAAGIAAAVAVVELVRTFAPTLPGLSGTGGGGGGVGLYQTNYNQLPSGLVAYDTVPKPLP